MSTAPYRVALLDATHDRTTFRSGSAPLDEYFQERVTQDVRRRITACFVALTDAQQVAGYYTMATASLLLNELPPTLAKKLPRYPTVPTIRMGRLAIDQEHQGKGLGGALLADGLDRAARSEIAAYAVLVDAKNSTAVDFYRHHGFIALPDSPQTLFLPLAALPK